MQWFSYRCTPIGGRVNLLCRVYVDTTILCNRNQKVKYILLLLYKLLRKSNGVTFKPRVCRHRKGTTRKLVDIIPTIISLINILITQSYYKWKCFSLYLITVILTLAQWPWPDQPQMQSKARSSWQLSIDKVSSILVEIH